jgi:dTDP-glucose 4,6-dehydratase
MRILITGGAGFIGSHVVGHFLRNTKADLTLIDRLDCSGNLNRLVYQGCPNPRVKFIYHDLRAPINEPVARLIGDQDAVLHIAAATHVDRSIDDPMSFVLDNVVATCNVLDYVRRYVPKARTLYFSTDEVFGPAPEGVAYGEWDRYKSGNPYAATKAGGEELAISYANTYGIDVFVTHTMNVIGPMQHWEKFVPSTIRKVMLGETVTIHADSTRTKPGSRFYIHAGEVAAAVGFLIDKAERGEKYNIVGAREVDNLALARMIAEAVGKPLKFDLVDFHSSRPGHDLRYALSGKTMAKMGWTPPIGITSAIRQIVDWYKVHPEWLGLDSKRAAA